MRRNAVFNQFHLPMIVLKDFILFLKTPNLENQIEINTISNFLKLIWKSFFIVLIIDAIVFFVISSPLKFFDLFPSQIEINYNYYTVTKISLLFPIIEELIFRLPLKISRKNLAISLSLILFVLLSKLNIYLSISLALLLFIILFFIINKDAEIFERVNALSIKYFLFIFYSQALIFGLFHLNNYKLDIQYFYLFPLFITSHIITGCFFGYLRVRFSMGIYLCIITHILINSVNCLILLK
jgi:hypothetical protein